MQRTAWGNRLLNIRCQCGRQLKVPESAIGHSGKCPYCHVGVRLIGPNYEAGNGPFSDRLVISSGPIHAGDQLVLGGPGPIEIGKLPGKPILLAGNKVSRSHCRLVRANGTWSIEDQGSKNGTQVNGQRITRRALQDGDVLQVGEFLLQFLADPDKPASPAPQPPPPPPPVHPRPVTPATPVAPNPASPAAQTVALAPAENDGETQADAPPPDDHLYGLSSGELIDTPTPIDEPEPKPPDTQDGPECPGCRRRLPKTAKICVNCGINLKTGRAILTASEENLDEIYATVESILHVVSWPLWMGFFPIASEALGVRRPYVTWGITAVTIFISMGVYIAEIKDPLRDRVIKQYMLWCGNAVPTAEDIEMQYWLTNYGDDTAYEAKKLEIESRIHPAKRKNISDDEIALEALRQLPIKDRCYGQYEPAQLITSAFLHGGIMHLVGNMIFLLVIGGRVNAMIGNLATIILYPLLAAAAGLIYMTTAAAQLPHPLIGASGAIMGLAGMYFVLVPINKVHMVWWWRPWFVGKFQLNYKMWAARGFWVLLFYISFDVLYTVFGIEDNVAHWAHLGGFLTGMAVALLLIVTRLVNARGGDLLSALLGRRAWLLVGKPDATRRSLIAIF